MTTHPAHHIKLPPTAGVVVKMLVEWLPVTILTVQWNGSTSSVLASPINLGIALTLAENRFNN